MRLLVWITALFLASSVPASAGPVAGLVAAVFAGVTAKAVALFALRLFASVGLSLLQQRRARRGRNRSFGLQVTATTRGELESETSIIGLYATKGHLIYHNSHGPNNKYYQTVIELGGLPGATFSRIMVDGVYSELGTEAHPDYGLPLIAKRDLGVDYAWIKVYDGTQTTADPTLVAKYAEDAETPWTEAHVGRGIPYAILTMEVSSKVWPNGAPEQRYEENGIPFYDPRLDSTVGGAGLHRWGDPTTWEPTRNPIVKIYNILRGIALYDGSIWGGEADAEDLPLWNWVPAMNACDVDVTGRPQYEAGYEIKFAEDTPGDVVNELLAACSGQIAEFGGFWYVQVGAPDIAVATITDDDLLVTDAATKDPFPELLEIFNRVTAKYVSPGALWNGVPLNMIRNATWEAEDGIARNFEMDLPAVFNPGQAGQLAEDALKDHRRWRRHAWPLPPDYAGLRPLNTVSVTSVWNDYDAKLFEVTEIVLDLHRLTIVTSLRERDPADFVINPTLEIPDRAQILPRPIPTDEGLPLFDAAARKVFNQAGTRAHAVVDVFWDASGISETIKGIAIECEKRETEEEVWSGTVLDVERGLATIQPVPALTNLRVRAKALADNRRGIWSAWIWITSDDVRVETADLAQTLTTVAIPSGLAVASVLVADGVARVSAAWAAVADAVAYEVGATTGGVETIFPAGGTAWSRDGVPGTAISIRVRAVSAIGIKSDWSDPVGITSAVDTIPPAVPSGLSAVGIFEGIWVKWAANSESDLSRYEVVERVSATAPGVSTVPTYITTTPQFISQNLTGGQTLNYWVRAVDTSGNKSGWSVRETATARAVGDVITTEALADLIDATSFAAGLEPVTVVGSLPTVKSTELVAFGGKIYRWDGTAYVASVASTDVVGQFTAASIAAGAIGADQLAARSVATKNLLVTDLQNLWRQPQVNGLTEEGTDVLQGADIIADPTGSAPTTHVVRFPTGNALQPTWANWSGAAAERVAVQRGEPFYISALVYVTGSLPTNFFFQAAHYNGSGAFVSSTTLSLVSQLQVGAWVRVVGAITLSTSLPAEYSTALFRFLGVANQTQNVYLTDVRLWRANGAQVTVDGSLQARHIDVNDLVVSGLATVATAYITNANIIDLNAAKLTAGSITTDKINGRDITDPLSFFENYGGGTKTPATAPSWNNATAFSVVVPDSGSILLVDCHVNWLLNGGSTAASWGLQFLLNGVAFDSMGGSYFQELAPFRRAIPVSAGTHTITLQCQRGTTSTFLIQNVHSVVTILKR
ncbi:phage tail protein [Roseovarius sp.]|uniref:phage tail protein n=1 Tax=Roseovarius sp. TaxID=1486281 RepID=UPI003A98118F